MDEFNEQAPGFRELGSRINDYLAGGDDDPAGEEQSAGAPILHSLDESRYHFSDEEFLVEGGAKRIYKVYDSHAGRHVALAMPHRHDTRQDKEEFLREAQLTAKLQHPNILPVYEVGLNSDGVPYFVMRLLEGEELKNIVRERTAGHAGYLERYDPVTLLEIFLKVCDAVIYTHSRGVLHLDLKPSNIMVGGYGQVTLFDWGLARVVGDDGTVDLDRAAEVFDPDLLNNITYSGTMKGTPGYMAPEQVVDSGHVTARTDVYALGALLYFILTGTIPVRGTHAEEVIENTLAGNIIRPRLRRPSSNIPRSLAAVALKALKREPAERYATVRELHDDITRYLRGFAPRAERAGLLKRAQLFSRRHSKMLFAGMLFGMILTVVVSISLARVSVQRSRALAARQEAVHNLELYKEETRISSELYTEVKTFFNNSIYRGDVWNYKLMRDMVNKEMEKEIDDPKYRRQLFVMKGYLHFINEEFAAAVAALDEAGFDTKNNLYRQCVVFSEIKPDDSVPLEAGDFAHLLEMSHRNTLFRKSILSRCYERHMARVREVDPEAYLPIAIAMLNLTNDTIGWGGDVRLARRNGGHHLDLSGAPYSTLRLSGTRWRQGGALLKPLQLVSLDLSGSSVRDFHGLVLQEGFRELILLDIEIFDMEPTAYWLGEIPMERLVIREGAVPPFHLSRLERKVKVIQLPSGAQYP
jgi:serine/threonine-protein kinase